MFDNLSTVLDDKKQKENPVDVSYSKLYKLIFFFHQCFSNNTVLDALEI